MTGGLETGGEVVGKEEEIREIPSHIQGRVCKELAHPTALITYTLLG
jgi:hypothetical protein